MGLHVIGSESRSLLLPKNMNPEFVSKSVVSRERKQCPTTCDEMAPCLFNCDTNDSVPLFNPSNPSVVSGLLSNSSSPYRSDDACQEQLYHHMREPESTNSTPPHPNSNLTAYFGRLRSSQSKRSCTMVWCCVPQGYLCIQLLTLQRRQ